MSYQGVVNIIRGVAQAVNPTGFFEHGRTWDASLNFDEGDPQIYLYPLQNSVDESNNYFETWQVVMGFFFQDAPDSTPAAREAIIANADNLLRSFIATISQVEGIAISGVRSEPKYRQMAGTYSGMLLNFTLGATSNVCDEDAPPDIPDVQTFCEKVDECLGISPTGSATEYLNRQGQWATPAGGGGSGANGWTPVLAIVTDGTRRVQQVVDWTGGTGTKPATGVYVGASGFVNNIADAVDIRGAQGPQGEPGATGPQGLQGEPGAGATIIETTQVEFLALVAAQDLEFPATYKITDVYEGLYINTLSAFEFNMQGSLQAYLPKYVESGDYKGQYHSSLGAIAAGEIYTWGEWNYKNNTGGDLTPDTPTANQFDTANRFTQLTKSVTNHYDLCDLIVVVDYLLNLTWIQHAGKLNSIQYHAVAETNSQAKADAALAQLNQRNNFNDALGQNENVVIHNCRVEADSVLGIFANRGTFISEIYNSVVSGQGNISNNVLNNEGLIYNIVGEVAVRKNTIGGSNTRINDITATGEAFIDILHCELHDNNRIINITATGTAEIYVWDNHFHENNDVNGWDITDTFVNFSNSHCNNDVNLTNFTFDDGGDYDININFAHGVTITNLSNISIRNTCISYERLPDPPYAEIDLTGHSTDIVDMNVRGLYGNATTAERLLLYTVDGMVIFDTDKNLAFTYKYGIWLPVEAGIDNQLRQAGTDFTGFGTNITANADIGDNLRATIGNSGSITRNTSSFSDATGVVDFNTNLNSAGRVCVLSFGWYLGNKHVVHRARFKIPVLATTAQNFNTGIGLVNSTSLASVTEGVYVYCASGTNSGNWVIQTKYGGLTTTFNTSIAPVADTFTDITIYVNAAGDEVRVFFNTTEPSGVGYPITTNIPAASTGQLFGAVCFEKTNGTTNCVLSVDKLNTYNF